MCYKLAFKLPVLYLPSKRSRSGEECLHEESAADPQTLHWLGCPCLGFRVYKV